MTQISLFDGEKPLKITKPIRLIEMFAGYGSQALALKYLGVKFEHWKIAEWAVKSIQAYKDMHFYEDNTDYSKAYACEELIDILAQKGISADYNAPMSREQIKRMGEQKIRTVFNNIVATNNLVSVCNINAQDLDIIDTDKYTYIMTYSFPCFTADSLVLTSNGYKPITEIKVGDMVLTHDNTYQKVVNVFDNGVKPTLKINAMAVDEINCTHNHKFYVRSMSRVGHKWERVFSSPCWKTACELTKKDYLGIAINQKSIIPEWNGIDFTWTDGRKTRHKNQLQRLMDSTDFWWLIGRYMGDGWCRQQGGIIICCAYDELNDITAKLDNLFNYHIVNERTVCKIHIPLKELSEFVQQFGKGAINKHLTNTIIDLPRELLKSFLDGYISADGCITNGVNKITSISRELIYGVAQCIAKVYRTPYRVYCTNRPKTCIIEGRTVNQHNSYELVWKEQVRKQDKAFYENGYIWFPITNITEDKPQNVYDIEVENNHSFTVQNTIVHNCQDLSKAGKTLGMAKGSGTRSGMLWEIERILDELYNNGGGQHSLPQILIMENVPDVIGSNNIKHFAQWVGKLAKLGYTSKWQCLNGKNYGVPQNRDRCFMVSWLGDYYYDFPQPIKLEKRLKDLLETTVDSKYYLSERIVQYYTEHTKDMKEKGNGFKFEPTDGNVVGKAITTRAGGRMDDNFIKRHCVGMLGGKYENMHDISRRVYSADALAPTMHTCGGGNLEPKIVEPTAFDEQNNYLRQDGCIGTLTTDGSSPKHNNRIIELIRKLTPKEAFRLMGVKDEDFDRVAQHQSNSSLYHLAGDSIITDVLMSILKEMI